MDKNVTKITKKRLSDFLAYEWIFIIFICVIAVIGVNLIYTMTSVSLTVGQQFKIYYDYDIYQGCSRVVSEQLRKDEALSFDVLELTSENLLEADDMLFARYSTHDGDLFVTTTSDRGKDLATKTQLAKTRVDSYDFYIYENLYKEAKTYLRTMLKDGLAVNQELELNYANLDPQKIEQGFNERLGKDNRFRKSQKQEGLRLEKMRIERLCKEVEDFGKLLKLSDEYFFTYTKYEQIVEKAEKEGNKTSFDTYKPAYDLESTSERANARYGLRVDVLAKNYPSEDKDLTEILRTSGDTPSSENIVIMVFNFREHQPELQFETISAINSIVRSFSTILD